MARVKRGVTGHARHKKVLDAAKGYVGRSSRRLSARRCERVEKALQYAYRDRRNKKREFRGSLDPAHQRRRARAGPDLFAAHERHQEGRHRASTARSWPISPITDPDGFKALVDQAKAALA